MWMQTLFVALLDGSLNEGLDVSVSLEEGVMESACLFGAHPQDP